MTSHKTRLSSAKHALIYVYILFIFIFLFFSLHGSYEVVLTLDKEKHTVDGPIYYYMFNTLLFCLLVLHIYWWVLIFRMLVKQVQARGRVSEDVRSGDNFVPKMGFYVAK